MQNISDAAIFVDPGLAVPKSAVPARTFTLDTTLVLFFLAMEVGQGDIGFDGISICSMLTLVAFLVLPYFLPATSEDGRGLVKWLVGRVIVAATGALFGLFLGQAVGSLLPESFRFVPMSLLIVAAIICCNIQIYGIMRFRLAR